MTCLVSMPSLMILSATRRRTGSVLLGHVDHAAAAFADLLQQLVAAERLAHGFVGRIGEIELDRGPRGFGLRGQQRFGLLVRGEQRFEALAQGRVAFAHDIEKRGALLRRLFQRQRKQGFFASRIHVEAFLN